MILLSIVEVAAIPGGTPTAVYTVVMAISGSPTSNGIPTGIDFMATTIDVVTKTTPQDTSYPSEMKTK